MLTTTSSFFNSRIMTTISNKRRVKLYELSPTSAWDDMGTGYCDIKNNKLIVISEENDCILLSTEIIPQDVYQRQVETLIVWTELDGRDLALSFQNQQDCTEIWLAFVCFKFS
jgi:protein phosphatase 4 regulatory subunit 3